MLKGTIMWIVLTRLPKGRWHTHSGAGPFDTEFEACKWIEKARRYDVLHTEYRYTYIGDPDTWKECI